MKRKLPQKLPREGLLVGYSLEAEVHKPVIGFEFSSGDSDCENVIDPILNNSDGHLITIARTGSGKGVGCMIPALLRYPGPVIVIDPKGENYAVTARRRREMGQEVKLLDPFRVTGQKSDSLNPFDMIEEDDAAAIDQAAELAEMLVGSYRLHDPFWDQMAESLITYFILHVAKSRPPILRNLSEIYYILSQSRPDVEFTFKEMAKSKLNEVRRGAAIHSSSEPKVFASILSTAHSHVDFLRSPIINTSLGQSTISLKDVTEGAPMSIYIVLPPEKLDSHSKLLRLWIGTLLSAITKRRSRLPNPTLFMLDEAAQLGPLNHLRQAITLLRGYGVRTWSFWQDLSQLKNLYPNDWKNMVNNCEVLQAFGFANAGAAKDGAELTGFPHWPVLQDLAPDEMVLAIAGDEAVIARKPNYLTDPAFNGLFDSNPFHQASGLSPEKGPGDVEQRSYARGFGGQRFRIRSDEETGETALLMRDPQTIRETLLLLSLFWRTKREDLEQVLQENFPQQSVADFIANLIDKGEQKSR